MSLMLELLGVNFYTPTIFRSIGFQGTKVGLLASGESAIFFFFLITLYQDLVLISKRVSFPLADYVIM